MTNEERWLSSKGAKKILQVSDCQLSHLRNEGKLVFMKKRIRLFSQPLITE